MEHFLMYTVPTVAALSAAHAIGLGACGLLILMALDRDERSTWPGRNEEACRSRARA